VSLSRKIGTPGDATVARVDVWSIAPSVGEEPITCHEIEVSAGSWFASLVTNSS